MSKATQILIKVLIRHAKGMLSAVEDWLKAQTNQ